MINDARSVEINSVARRVINAQVYSATTFILELHCNLCNGIFEKRDNPLPSDTYKGRKMHKVVGCVLVVLWRIQSLSWKFNMAWIVLPIFTAAKYEGNNFGNQRESKLTFLYTIRSACQELCVRFELGWVLLWIVTGWVYQYSSVTLQWHWGNYVIATIASGYD